MEYTADRIENETIISPSLLNIFQCFRFFWFNQGHDDQNKVENIAIRCSNCGKETMVSMDNMNNTYQDIITSFVLNTVLHHFGVLWIIETKQHLEYDM